MKGEGSVDVFPSGVKRFVYSDGDSNPVPNHLILRHNVLLLIPNRLAAFVWL